MLKVIPLSNGVPVTHTPEFLYHLTSINLQDASTDALINVSVKTRTANYTLGHLSKNVTDLSLNIYFAPKEPVVFEAKAVKGKAGKGVVVSLIGQSTTIVSPPHGLPVYELPLSDDEEEEEIEESDDGADHMQDYLLDLEELKANGGADDDDEGDFGEEEEESPVKPKQDKKRKREDEESQQKKAAPVSPSAEKAAAPASKKAKVAERTMLAVPVERRVGQGIIAIEKAVGAGKVAQNGKRVTVQFSGQRSTGVAIPSGEMTFRLGVGEFIRGFDYGVAGMKVGGIRSLKVPKDMTDQKGKDLEYVTYQVELIDVL